jgi:hypothetical protein
VGSIEIRFRMNMRTGKKDILIDFESDEDAMRHEHERAHKKIIERLVGEGVLTENEAGEIIIQRAAPGQPVASPETPRQEGQVQQQGGGS